MIRVLVYLRSCGTRCVNSQDSFTAQKIKFSIEDFSSKCDQVRSFSWIWSNLLKKSSMENFIFCAVKVSRECTHRVPFFLCSVWYFREICGLNKSSFCHKTLHKKIKTILWEGSLIVVPLIINFSKIFLPLYS